MILTDRFVYIHMPKTGGTFVTKAIRTASAHAGDSSSKPIDVVKHGSCNEIPSTHRHLPIVSTVRSPYDRYVSYYEYSWWRRHEMPGISRAEIRRTLPNYPDISFAEFVELSSGHFNEVKTSHPDGVQPGYYTERFIHFYFRDPARALAGLHPEYVSSGTCRDDMYDVRFLRAEHLTDDTCEFLDDMGFGPDALAAVRKLGRVNPPRIRVGLVDHLLRYSPRRTERDWRTYYTPELAELVRTREWLLFELFPELDVAVV